MALPESTRSQIDSILRQNPIVLFMKGTRHFPQCGFSATVVSIVGQYAPKFETVNVLASPEIREGIKEYSRWPTIPQLYVNGKLVGGCDIVKEMHESGELAAVFGAEAKVEEPKAPMLHLSAAAAAAILEAAADAHGDPLRVQIGPRFETELFFDTKTDGDFAIESDGVHIVIEKNAASRANGLSIDFAPGLGFRIENPNAPPRVKAMSAAELRDLLTKGSPLELLDVRTDAEIATAKIPGSKVLDGSHLQTLPKDARIVLYCHHGTRSQRAAEQLLADGFKNVHNLEGGIDAFSQVDESIPRY